ncbi:hypothetical protein VIGAN_09111500, partial [Vigna angularis var. angularis]
SPTINSNNHWVPVITMASSMPSTTHNIAPANHNNVNVSPPKSQQLCFHHQNPNHKPMRHASTPKCKSKPTLQ